MATAVQVKNVSVTANDLTNDNIVSITLSSVDAVAADAKLYVVAIYQDGTTEYIKTAENVVITANGKYVLDLPIGTNFVDTNLHVGIGHKNSA